MNYLSFRRSLQCLQQQQRRLISTTAAKSMLGFNKETIPTVKELRHAYFEAAKQCHPDMQRQNEKEGKPTQLDFRLITEAYEHLLNGDHVRESNDFEISIEEEEQYRQACLQVLGIPAGMSQH